jgi:hypothetical protein
MGRRGWTAGAPSVAGRAELGVPTTRPGSAGAPELPTQAQAGRAHWLRSRALRKAERAGGLGGQQSAKQQQQGEKEHKGEECRTGSQQRG